MCKCGTKNSVHLPSCPMWVAPWVRNFPALNNSNVPIIGKKVYQAR